MRLMDGTFHFYRTNPGLGYEVTVQDGGATALWGGPPPIELHWNEAENRYEGDPGYPRLYISSDHTYIWWEPGIVDTGTWEDPQAII